VAQPASEVPQQVERRLLRPVEVLDGHNREDARLIDLTQHRREQRLARRARSRRIEKWSAELFGDVERRSKGTGCEETVAGGSQPARLGRLDLELLQERGLSGASPPATSSTRPAPAIACPAYSDSERSAFSRSSSRIP